MFDFIFYKKYKNFKSDYGKTRTISLLKENIYSDFLVLTSIESIRGYISDKRLRISRGKPFVQNSFKPFYYGKILEDDDGKAIINGFYAMHLFVRIFCTVWFGCVALVAFVFAGYLIYLYLTEGIFHIIELAPFLFIFFLFYCGYLLVYFGQKISKNDISFLNQFMENTLKKS